MRTLAALSLAVLMLVSLPAIVAGDEPTESFAKAYCVTFVKDGDANCAAMEKAFMGKLKKDFAEKDVLFLTADLTSKASRHQAGLLMNGLSLGDAWTAHAGKPGTVVLCEPEWGNIKATFTATTKEAEARSALEKALKAKAEEEDGEDDDG